VPELANRQSNVRLVSGQLWAKRREVALAAVRAIAEAETRIHTAQAEVVDALARELPSRDRRELETIVRLYEPSVPATPEVRAQDLAPALALIPESVPKPELAGIDLAPFVASGVVSPPPATKAANATAAAPASGARVPWLAIALGALVLVAILFVVRSRRAKGSI
jgi:hypothetical protein